MATDNSSAIRLTPMHTEPPFLQHITFLDELFWKRRDPRVFDYPLMRDLSPNFGLMALYLLIVYYGPKIMAPHKPFNLKYPLIAYNFFMVGSSFYILFEILYTAYLSSYTLFCQPVDYSTNPLPTRMSKAIWMYFFSRYIEFTDTLFFILRKKNNQISFLHVYHHVSIAGTWWCTGNIAAGGMISYNAALNCFIHVVMYTYYGLSAFGPGIQKYLWWKVHLTKLQILQFLCMLILMSYNTTCDDPHFPQCINYIGIVYCSTILGLFLNFYIQTYFFKKNAKTAVTDKPQTNGVKANGKHE